MKIFLVLGILLIAKSSFASRVCIFDFDVKAQTVMFSWMKVSVKRTLIFELRKEGWNPVPVDTIPKNLDEIKENLSEDTKYCVKGTFKIEGDKIDVTTEIFGHLSVSAGIEVDGVKLIDSFKISGRTTILYELKYYVTRLVKMQLQIAEKTSEPFIPAVTVTETPKTDAMNEKLQIKDIRKIEKKLDCNAPECIYFNRAIESGDEETEIKYYLACLFFSPYLWQAWFNLAVIFLQKGKPEFAQYFLAKFLEFYPHNDETKQIVKSVLVDILLEQNPSSARELAVTNWYKALELGDFSEAQIRYLKLAVEVDPTFWPAWADLAKIYYAQGAYTLALECIERYLENTRDAPQIKAKYKMLRDFLVSIAGLHGG